VLHNLALFSGNGKYLRLSAKPETFDIGGENLALYRFTLSPLITEVEGGTLESLIQRIGSGEVFVVIDDTPRIRRIAIYGENYISTTTITSLNGAVPIEIPLE
jgi:hypothetical protein